jgi:hypothetical protein
VLHANQFSAKMAGLCEAAALANFELHPGLGLERPKIEIDVQFQNMSTIGKSARLLFFEKWREKMRDRKTMANWHFGPCHFCDPTQTQ